MSNRLDPLDSMALLDKALRMASCSADQWPVAKLWLYRAERRATGMAKGEIFTLWLNGPFNLHTGNSDE